MTNTTIATMVAFLVFDGPQARQKPASRKEALETRAKDCIVSD